MFEDLWAESQRIAAGRPSLACSWVVVAASPAATAAAGVGLVAAPCGAGAKGKQTAAAPDGPADPTSVLDRPSAVSSTSTCMAAAGAGGGDGSTSGSARQWSGLDLKRSAAAGPASYPLPARLWSSEQMRARRQEASAQLAPALTMPTGPPQAAHQV